MTDIASVVVDPEFAALIPPISGDEYRQLEANLTTDGCRDALVVWPVNGKGILLDGHNRLKICTDRGLAYSTVNQALADRQAATIWIIRNQFGRRNLQPFQRAELAVKLEPAIAEQAKEKQEREGRELGGALKQISAEGPLETRIEVAKAAGLSHDTIAKAKVIVAKAPEEVKDQLRRVYRRFH